MIKRLKKSLSRKLENCQPFGVAGGTAVLTLSRNLRSAGNRRTYEHQQWFHGDISREECHRRLTDTGIKDGTFLVRSRGQYFVLSTCWDNDISHYLINVDNGKYGIPGGRIFSNLNQMVSYYSHRKDGLPCCLRNVCVRPMTIEPLGTTSDQLNGSEYSSQSQGSNSVVASSTAPLIKSSDSQNDLGSVEEKSNTERTGLKNEDSESERQDANTPINGTPKFSVKIVSSKALDQTNGCRDSPAKMRNSDSPYFNFTPLSMQQSSSFTGMDCLDALENLAAETENGDVRKKYPFKVVSASKNSPQSERSRTNVNGNYLQTTHKTDFRRASSTLPLEKEGFSNLAPRESRGFGKGNKKSSHDGFDYTFINRLTVEDQDTTTASGSKRDYSAEHRSENSPSPLSGGLCTNNSISPHYKSTSKHYNQTGSRNHKIAHDSTSATSTSHPKSDPKDYHHRKEPSSKSRDPSGAGSNTVTLDENVLENCDLYLYYQLGVGNFGVVMQGVLRNLESGKERSVAVKILRCSEGESAETSRQQMLREAKVMSELNHPNVIKLIGIFNGPELMLVSELAPIGQLNKYLKKNKSVPVEMLMNYALQVANGMAYLERKSFVHRDLAARNVLLATDRHARISDFGMSRMLSFNKDYYRANDGGHWPVRWYAPQCIYFFTFTSKSDVWSYGVTLWEIFSYGQRPYGNMRSNEILEMIDKGARLKCPAGCPPEMFSLMLRCWEYEESDRPTFEEIYQVVEIYFRAQASKSRDVYTG